MCPHNYNCIPSDHPYVCNGGIECNHRRDEEYCDQSVSFFCHFGCYLKPPPLHFTITITVKFIVNTLFRSDRFTYEFLVIKFEISYFSGVQQRWI
jgi:hypothetical protein